MIIRGKISVSQYRKLRRRTPRCLRKKCGTENVYTQVVGGEYYGSPWKKFCLTVLKRFVGEPLGVSEKFRCRKSLGKRDRERGIPILRRNIFASKYRNISQRNPSVFH